MAASRRADAERNRAVILEVARKAFSDQESHISMAEVARRSGVGMATLYRNFPGRRELLEALYVDEVAAICAAARHAEGDTPGADLMWWLHRFFDFTLSKRHIASELLAASGQDDSLLGRNRPMVERAGAELLSAAQRSGEIRGDLSLDQVLDMIIAIGTIQGDTESTRAIVSVALDGLRSQPPDR